MEVSLKNRQVVLQKLASGELSADREGRVWRHGRATGCSGRYVQWDVPKQIGNPGSGYLRIGGRNKNSREPWSALAHHVVWLMFFGDIPDGMTINHINGIKTDNRPCNLELATPKRQAEHALDLGLRPFGERSWSAKLSRDDVIQILNSHASGEGGGSLGRRFGVSRTQINRIVRGGSWKRSLQSLAMEGR